MRFMLFMVLLLTQHHTYEIHPTPAIRCINHTADTLILEAQVHPWAFMCGDVVARKTLPPYSSVKLDNPKVNAVYAFNKSIMNKYAIDGVGEGLVMGCEFNPPKVDTVLHFRYRSEQKFVRVTLPMKLDSIKRRSFFVRPPRHIFKSGSLSLISKRGAIRVSLNDGGGDGYYFYDAGRFMHFDPSWKGTFGGHNDLALISNGDSTKIVINSTLPAIKEMYWLLRAHAGEIGLSLIELKMVREYIDKSFIKK